MFTSNERSIRKQAQVDFTRSGWRQFMRLNRTLGARFLRGFVLRYELAAYLTAHEAAGFELDEGWHRDLLTAWPTRRRAPQTPPSCAR